MNKAIILIIGLLIVLTGVILIYDSRIITKKLFSFGDQNEGTFSLKVIGFILSIIGSIVIFLS